MSFKDNYQPRIIFTKFDGVCSETGKPIKKGERCIYDPLDKKLYRLDSPSGKDYLESLNHKLAGSVRD